MVTWKNGVGQKTLKSENEVKDAENRGLVLMDKTRMVLKCPVVFTDAGGLLPKAIIWQNDGSGDNVVYRNR